MMFIPALVLSAVTSFVSGATVASLIKKKKAGKK